MRLPKSESEFYQLLREETLGSIFWERLELKSDTGFPDTHFVLRRDADSKLPPRMPCEGTVELKFQRDYKTPDRKSIKKLMKGDQQANFIEYSQAGGRRRFLLICNMAGSVFLYSTQHVVEILLGKREGDAASSSASFEDDTFPVRNWLPAMLEMNW